MKATIAVVIEHDAAQWARQHGIPETDALDHFIAALRCSANEGHITAALDEGWPLMRGHTTARTLDGLDAATRDELLGLLNQARDAEQDHALITEIRHQLTTYRHNLGDREPRWVVLRTCAWDNGHFLSGRDAAVYFPDGEHLPFDFSSRVDDLLTDMYGARGAIAALGVDLREATLEFDDYGDNVYDTLGIPTSKHSEGDGCAIYPSEYTVITDGTPVPVTDLRQGDLFLDYDGTWRAGDVGRDGYDVHVNIQPVHEG